MKSLIVVRLWAPWTQRFVARNWKRAISGWAETASRVANRTSVSTPLRTRSVLRTLVLMAPPDLGAARLVRGGCGRSSADARNAPVHPR